MAMTLRKSRLRLTQAIYFGQKQSGGSVSQVSGGNGIATTPNPITGVGTVQLGTLTSNHDFGNFRIDAQNTTRWFNVVAFGADPTGAADSTAAIQAAVTAASSGGYIYLPRGTYKVIAGVTNTTAGVMFVGDGRGSTTVNFAPVGAASVFRFSNGAGTINNCAVRGITFTSADAANTKIAIEVIDAVNFAADDINISGGWTGASSIGIKVSGRQEVRVRDCAINSADLPIVIGVNPNLASISFDHSSIESSELVVTAATNNPAITISDGLAITNATFRHLALVQGDRGISMNNTSMAIASQVIVIEDCRTEQTNGSSGYSIDLRSSSGQIQNVSIRNIQLDPNRNGVRFTNVKYSTMENVIYGGTGTFVDASASVSGLVLVDCFTQTGSTITDASVSPITIGYTLGGNPPVTGYGTLSPPTGVSVGLTANTRMLIGAAAGQSGSQVDIFRDGVYNSESTAGIYIKSGSGATNTGILIGTDKTNSTGFIQTSEPSTSYASKPLSLNPNGGNVGVGTLGATRTLDLNGPQRWRGIAAPAVSEANSGTIYFDSGLNKLRASLNGSAYVDLIGSAGLTGSGVAGKVTYWDGAASVAGAANIYADSVNHRLGIKVATPLYGLDMDGDINITTGSVIRVNSLQVLKSDTATQVVAVGDGTGPALGNNSTAVGHEAINVGTGLGNTAVGRSGLVATTSGARNTGLGDQAGATNSTGDNNLYLGYQADGTAGNLTNAVAIGYQASVAASDTMSLGNASMKVGIHTTTAKTALDVDGAISTRHKNIAVVNDLNSNIALTDTSWVRLTGPTGVFSIGGFTNFADGRVLRIYNTVAFAMTIVNEDGSSTAANRIWTLTGGNVTLRAGTSSCTLVYDDADDRWILLSSN